MRQKLTAALLIGVLALTFGQGAGAKNKDVPYKVYVILGFHANFYHSWRGDTPDEAGFGTDIRIVREIIRMLNEANQKGLDAKGYWESENLFTLENIIPEYAPDIIEGIKERVEAGKDEILLAPYSNSLFSAMTGDEVRAAIRWSIENPWGSGVEDIYGEYVPIVRPQEAMFTTGLIPILKEEGVEGVILPYSCYPFTAFSNFVRVMPPEQRYNPTMMRMQDGGPSIMLFPCVSIGDVVSYTSLEKWMLKLRKMQEEGEVERDLVIHINFDADAETWLPMDLPRGMRWMPNAGGLPEYIRYVNKYEWAEFTNPGEYLETHEPVGEVLIRQDMADGPWDGNYAWAEKLPSHRIWTDLEESRLFTYQARALLSGAPGKAVHDLLYSGRDSSFFQRVKGVSTTHFGMSTPMVNEERQAVAEDIVSRAGDYARQALSLAGEKSKKEAGKSHNKEVYRFKVVDARDEVEGKEAFTLARIPVILEEIGSGLELLDHAGREVPFSVVNIEKLHDARTAAELMVPLKLGPREHKTLMLVKADAAGQGEVKGAQRLMRLDNGEISMELDMAKGVKSLRMGSMLIGGEDFLEPFITYKTGRKAVTYGAGYYELADLSEERWEGVKRARLFTKIAFKTRQGYKEAPVEITFTLPDGVPWLVADVHVDYPYTKKEDILSTMQQKLRRYLDLGWIEVAPLQLHPLFHASREDPIKAWKHNWLDVTSWYEMDYAKINPKNAQWDSMNHQVTAGWVAVTDKEKGLLLAQSSEKTSSYAFVPMRLEEDKDKNQELRLNPFGSYQGKQPDYSHMGGNGLGTDMAIMAGAQFRPNAPSFNGESEEFSLLIAPYPGDKPPEKLRADAGVFFYPPAVVYVKTPRGVDALLKSDVDDTLQRSRRMAAMDSDAPLPVPRAFLANPTESAVHLVWDQPGDPRVRGYEVAWKPGAHTDWNYVETGRVDRHPVEGLQNGEEYAFKVRSLGEKRKSTWTDAQVVEVGPVKTGGILSMAKGASPKLILKTLHYSLVHVLTTPP